MSYLSELLHWATSSLSYLFAEPLGWGTSSPSYLFPELPLNYSTSSLTCFCSEGYLSFSTGFFSELVLL
jgi:hypothetical protein